MLGIHKSHSSSAATTYFTSSLSQEGYYLDDSVNAKWLGRIAKRLGLDGKLVTKEVFSDLVNNVHPETGERLTVRNAAGRVAGYDLTFSASKSVSVLYALTQDDNILKAHQNAYQEAMKLIEQKMQSQNNHGDERGFINCPEIIYGSFDHFTSRPCEYKTPDGIEYVSDPQLHTHCYVPNITWNDEKKRYQALEMGNSIHRLAPYYEAVFHSHLAHELNRLGYQTRRTKDRFEIAGISRSIIERFSNRTALIEETAKKKGVVDAKAKSELGAKTRHSKAKTISNQELLKHWRNRLTKGELHDIQNLKGKRFLSEAPISPENAVYRAIEHFEERLSVYQTKRVEAHALALGYGSLLPEDVSSALRSMENGIHAEIDTLEYMTTRDMLSAENKMIQMAVEGKGQFAPIHPSYKTKADFLSEEQQKAVRDLLISRDFVTLLKGSAGVGKTTLLSECREAAHSRNMNFLAVAASSQAADVLKKEGFDSATIAVLLHDEKLQKRISKGVLLVDEASLCGVKTLSQLMEISQQQNARMILSGDSSQHHSVEFGDGFRLLQNQAKLKTASVKKIIRQKPEDYNRAVRHLSNGRVLEGYQVLNKMGAVQEIPDHEQRLNQIADDYIDSVKAKRSSLIVSPTNHEGKLINDSVRAKMKQLGKIRGKEHEFTTYENLSFTNAQKKDTILFEEKQILRFVKNQKGGYKAGSHYEVLPNKDNQPIKIKHIQTGQILDLPKESVENFQVFRQVKTPICVGDTIRMTNNTKSLENSKLNNGNSYEVKKITKQGLVLSNGKTLAKDTGHFKHGYTQTSHSSQGKTVDDVFVSISDHSFSGASKEQLYVSVTRGRASVKIYTSSKDDLKKAIVRSGERMSAHELIKEKQAREQDDLFTRQQHHRSSLNSQIMEKNNTPRTVKNEISKPSDYGRQWKDHR